MTMTDYIGETVVLPPTPAAWADMQREITRLSNRLVTAASEISDLDRKIGNAAGVIRDYLSENGELTDELSDIARYLDVELTKEITGTTCIEISWTATVALDFDADDIEISYSIECESPECEDFDYNEDNCTSSGEDV
jgi:hypothetical protein